MNNKFIHYWLLCLTTLGLSWGLGPQRLLADGCASCAMGQSEQRVRFHIAGKGRIAGTANITVTYGDTTYTTTMSGGAVIWSPTLSRYIVDHYDCVQWAQEIVVEPRLDQPVKITYAYVADDQSPLYTEF